MRMLGREMYHYGAVAGEGELGVAVVALCAGDGDGSLAGVGVHD